MNRPFIALLATIAAASAAAVTTQVAAAGAAPTGLDAAAKITRTAKNTKLLCADDKSTDRSAKRAPKVCITLGPDDSFAEAVNLAQLSWKNWGKTTATATGIERGFHEPASKIAVKVTVSGVKANECGGFSYTRLKATSKNGTTSVKLPAACAD